VARRKKAFRRKNENSLIRTGPLAELDEVVDAVEEMPEWRACGLALFRGTVGLREPDVKLGSIEA
jgi:hypothetical protein